MKQWILLSIGLLMAISMVAQQDPGRALKDAKKNLGTYRLDPQSNSGDLIEAKKAIDVAVTGAEEASEAKTWLLKGDIYNDIAAQDVANMVVNPEYKPTVNNAALVSYNAYMKAKELAEKKYVIRDIQNGLREVASHLSNMGVTKYSQQDFEGAFKSFEAILNIREYLRENGDKSLLESTEDYNNQIFMTGLAALNSGNTDAAEKYFIKLYEIDYDSPAIYEALYQIKFAKEDESASKYLAEGREKYPDDLSLLYAEINDALRNNRLDELVGKLQDAIDRDPENKSLYSTLGNVYDQLFQTAEAEDNEEKSNEYFDKAKMYYEQALEKDPKYFDAMYSLGALYYNKAASFTQDMKDLEDDYSKEGLKKYETLKSKVFSYFEKALPYFKEAEMLNPNDINTLIALKEIYARENKIEVSNEFKQRLENVQAGKDNESYFKNN